MNAERLPSLSVVIVCIVNFIITSMLLLPTMTVAFRVVISRDGAVGNDKQGRNEMADDKQSEKQGIPLHMLWTHHQHIVNHSLLETRSSNMTRPRGTSAATVLSSRESFEIANDSAGVLLQAETYSDWHAGGFRKVSQGKPGSHQEPLGPVNRPLDGTSSKGSLIESSSTKLDILANGYANCGERRVFLSKKSAQTNPFADVRPTGECVQAKPAGADFNEMQGYMLSVAEELCKLHISLYLDFKDDEAKDLKAFIDGFNPTGKTWSPQDQENMIRVLENRVSDANAFIAVLPATGPYCEREQRIGSSKWKGETIPASVAVGYATANNRRGNPSGFARLIQSTMGNVVGGQKGKG